MLDYALFGLNPLSALHAGTIIYRPIYIYVIYVDIIQSIYRVYIEYEYIYIYVVYI